jgi:hypothetical protein
VKKAIAVILVVCAALWASQLRAGAEEYDLSGVYESISDDVKQRMAEAGAECVNVDSLSGLSFESILGQIADMAGEQSGAPLKGLVSITAILLICSMLSAYKGSLSQDNGFGTVTQNRKQHIASYLGQTITITELVDNINEQSVIIKILCFSHLS